MHHIPLNRILRKYNIRSPLRQASFFGNAIQETGWLQRLSEFGGNGLWYAPWYGRGFLQLTNPENYCDYWAWRGGQVNAQLRASLIQAYATTYALPVVQRTNAALQDTNFQALTQQMIDWINHVQSRPSPQEDEEIIAPADSAGF